MSTHMLDARRMLCPMPVIKTQNRVKELDSGDVLEIICTDKGALNDIPAWCRINGHHLVDSREAGNEYIIVIEVA